MSEQALDKAERLEDQDRRQAKMIVLIGFMGAGKTTIGSLVAERLGVPFVDVDVLIEQREHCSVRELFDTRGETYFRELEHETILELLEGSDAVLALGGGAPEHPGTRRALKKVLVVYLQVSYGEALVRISHDSYRPLLNAPDVRTIYERRLPVYQDAAVLRVPTDGRRPQVVAMEIISKVTTPPTVPAGTRSVLVAPVGGAYQVHVGSGLAAHLDALLPPMPEAEQAFVVTDETADAAFGEVERSLERRFPKVTRITVPKGESSKSFERIESIAFELAEGAAHKHDLVVGMGDEPVCDVAGFLAATYNRGMPLALVPTTLLAQVDSAIGGKNAINLPQGRNLVGTIHQPVVVVSDVALAAGNRVGGFRSGLAELVKHALIADESLLEVLYDRAGSILAGELDALSEVAARSAEIKSAIVTADEREHGERAHLHYGHTFAYAIEPLIGGEADRHGEAVALGMMAAAYLARRQGRVGEETVIAHRRALARLGLPVQASFELADLERGWLRDKKYRQGVRFVVLNGIARPESGVAADRRTLELALVDLAGR